MPSHEQFLSDANGGSHAAKKEVPKPEKWNGYPVDSSHAYSLQVYLEHSTVSQGEARRLLSTCAWTDSQLALFCGTWVKRLPFLWKGITR